MSTTPTPQPIVSSLHPISVYLKAHERLVLTFFAGLILWFALGKVDTLLINHDRAMTQQAQIVAQVQQEKNDATAKLIAQHDADTAALNAKIEARDAQLQQLQVTLVTALSKQQQVDKTLTPTELTQRWNTLVPEASASSANGQVTLPDSGAVATVVELEKAPVLQQQLTAETEELKNAQSLLAAEGQQVSDRDVLITGLQAKAVDDAKVCTAQIATVKAEARRSKRRWFIIGYVAGFVSRQFIKTETGL
jgi:hypothetical protein